MGVEPVSLVNALLIAEERGIQHARKTGAPEPGFETTVGVMLETSAGRTRVLGALVGDSHGRVIGIDDYHEDVAPVGWLLVISNRDDPGGIGNDGPLQQGSPSAARGRGDRGRERGSGADQRGARGAAAGAGRAAGAAGVPGGLIRRLLGPLLFVLQ